MHFFYVKKRKVKMVLRIIINVKIAITNGNQMKKKIPVR